MYYSRCDLHEGITVSILLQVSSMKLILSLCCSRCLPLWRCHFLYVAPGVFYEGDTVSILFHCVSSSMKMSLSLPCFRCLPLWRWHCLCLASDVSSMTVTHSLSCMSSVMVTLFLAPRVSFVIVTLSCSTYVLCEDDTVAILLLVCPLWRWHCLCLAPGVFLYVPSASESGCSQRNYPMTGPHSHWMPLVHKYLHGFQQDRQKGIAFQHYQVVKWNLCCNTSYLVISLQMIS